METGPLSSLEICSEPGTAGDRGWGEGPQGPAQMMVAQTPQTESLASWPVSERAGGQASKRAGTLTAQSLCFPLGFGSICLLLLSP